MISVLLAVCNAENYLCDAMDSLACQTCQDFEVVAIDDGSTDASLEILNSYRSASTLDLKIFSQCNQGLTSTLNRALSYSSGEYIARMDADDISLPERFSESLSFICEGDYDFIVTQAEQFSSYSTRRLVPNAKGAGRMLTPRLLRFGNAFVHGTFFMRRDVLVKHGYNEKYRTAQDYDLLCRLSRDTAVRMGYLDRVLYRLRVDPGSSGRKLGGGQLANARLIAKEHFGSDKLLIPGSTGLSLLGKRILKSSLLFCGGWV